MPGASPVPASELPELAIVGRITKAHGLRGDLSIEPHTDAPDAVFAPGARVLVGGSTNVEPRVLLPFVVRQATTHGKGIRLHLDGVEDRDAADVLRDRFVFVPLANLDPPSEGEVFRHHLIGMRVATSAGDDLGVVAGWYELPQGFMLEVRQADQELLIPFQDAFVREVNPRERQITVELPDGFLD